jgi:hypothetical protein
MFLSKLIIRMQMNETIEKTNTKGIKLKENIRKEKKIKEMTERKQYKLRVIMEKRKDS